MRRSRSKLPSLFAGVVFIVSAFGCNSKRTENLQSLSSPIAPLDVEDESNPKLDLPSREIVQSNSATTTPKTDSIAGKLTSREEGLPSPGRKNAFEFSETTTFANHDPAVAHRPLRVIGFVDAGQPSVMLVIDGKTHILSATQSIDHVTVQSIEPPLVQVTHHGSPQTLSLFDRHQ